MSDARDGSVQGDLVLGGEVEGELLELDEPVSFWGGVDPETGVIIDRHHPQCGVSLTGRLVLMRGSRGSSSSSSTMLECVRLGSSPSALLLTQRDALLAIGAAAAFELYGHGPSVVILPAGVDRAGATRARVGSDGVVHFST